MLFFEGFNRLSRVEVSLVNANVITEMSEVASCCFLHRRMIKYLHKVASLKERLSLLLEK